MSKRIPAKYKTELGELLAKWYRSLGGKVAPRRAYHEDDEGTGGGAANKMFEEHPFLMETPIGASSDLASTIVEDNRTLDDAQKRSEEMTEELQNKLSLQLGNKLQKQYQYRHQIKLEPY